MLIDAASMTSICDTTYGSGPSDKAYNDPCHGRNKHILFLILVCTDHK